MGINIAPPPTARFGRCYSLFHATRYCSTQRLGRYISKIWSPWKQDPYLSYNFRHFTWWICKLSNFGWTSFLNNLLVVHWHLYKRIIPPTDSPKTASSRKSCIPTSEDARSDGRLSVMASACLSDWQMAWQRALLHAGLPELVSWSWSEIEIPGVKRRLNHEWSIRDLGSRHLKYIYDIYI